MSADYSGGSSDALSRFFFVNPIDLNRAYPDGGAMSEMRCTYTKILIVTCYLLPTRFLLCCLQNLLYCRGMPQHIFVNKTKKYCL